MTSNSDTRRKIRAREQLRDAEGRELYSDASGEPVFRRSVTSFLDLLGTKNALLAMTQSQLREQIRLLDHLKVGLHDASVEFQWQRMLTFSDSIALAMPFKTDDPEPELGGTILSIASYQFELACTGRFLRGGIAIGEAYADYANITGPALVDAATLEAEIAVVPRVVLHESALQVVLGEVHRGYGLRLSSSPFNSTLMIDSDNRAFVNYLSTVFEAVGTDVEVQLKRHKDAVIDALGKYPGPPRVREKYVWLAHYHNAFCKLHQLDDSLQIDQPLKGLESRYRRPFRPLVDPSWDQEPKSRPPRKPKV